MSKIQVNKEETNTYRGYDLFLDIEDKDLQAHNRAAIMANICESHVKNDKITPGGAGLVIGYFDKVPPEERKPAFDKFLNTMQGRNFYMQVSKQ